MFRMLIVWGWIAAVLLLHSCAGGGPTSTDAGAITSPRGWFILTNGTAAQAADADRFFEQVRVCADAPSAEPRGIEVTFLPAIAVPGGTVLDCPEGQLKHKLTDGGCMDDHLNRMYVLDWTEQPWFSESFGHESIHLARWERTSRRDADALHAGPWWVGGKACQANLR